MTARALWNLHDALMAGECPTDCPDCGADEWSPSAEAYETTGRLVCEHCADAAMEKAMTDTVTAPRDDDSRPFSDSLLPDEMIWAGIEALEQVDRDNANYIAGKTTDWDPGMVAVAVYRAMLAAAPKADPCDTHKVHGIHLDPCCPYCPDPEAQKAKQEPVGAAEVEVGRAICLRIESLIALNPKPNTSEWSELTYLSHLTGCVEELGAFDGPTVSLAPASDELPTSIRDIGEERQRQVTVEGWSHERDDGYVDGDLAIAGACYALLGSRKWAIDALRRGVWPKGWSARWLKSEPNNPRRDLVKAGALIAAEIERLDRLAKHKGPQS